MTLRGIQREGLTYFTQGDEREQTVGNAQYAHAFECACNIRTNLCIN